LLAITRYNKSIHSVIDKRPVDAIQESTDDTQERIADKIKSAQDALRSRENASRQNRVFKVGEKVLVKTNRRLGNKLTPLCLSLMSAHITNYSQARYIPIIDGETLVWEELAYVTHSVNLSEYIRVIEETSSMY